ncbi:MAG: choice-of-anchor D domain-containing protein [Bacteroidetes bacterium]|nr:choice-of-anchor D domain-containing protein [Bacteroidota bacterium]
MNKITILTLKFFFVFYYILIINSGYSQGQQTFVTTSTFTVPAGVTSVTVETWGGGGKGGTMLANGSAGGGGGGAYARKTIVVTAGTNHTVTVGLGSTSTSPGGDSWFSTTATILAKGGNSVPNNITTGAAGGSATTSIGDFKFAGGNGSNGIPSKSGGGGGSSAGSYTNGVAASTGSGAIAPLGGGNGGNARSVTEGNAGNSAILGGGGGGGYRISTGTRTGGNGANGKVVITWGPQEIDLQGSNISIASGDTTPDGTDGTDFGSLDISSGSITKIFSIHNLGSATLNLNSISLSGSTDFTIVSTPTLPTTISGMNRTSFSIAFDPTVIGTKNATISIANNDTNENPYTFTIKGRGIQTFYDSDDDGVFDNTDIDDDNDGILDITEENNCRAVKGFNVNYKFLNETFGAGTNRTTINTTYAATTTYLYEPGGTGPNPYAGTLSLNDGDYTVGPSAIISTWAEGPTGVWYKGGDHTGDVNGRMAMFNADYSPGIFYTATITGALPQTPITYSFWVLNLDLSDAPGIATRLRPNIKVEFRDLNDNVLSTISTGEIAPTNSSNISGDWYNFTSDLVFNVSDFKVVFINNETGGNGNDLAIDDISISQTLCDRDGDGVADLFDLDADNDGIEDIIEVGLGSYSNGKGKIAVAWADVNGNGLLDSVESIAALPALDSDGDGVPNYLDLDSDNDSLFDVDESGAGNSNAVTGFINGDGDISGDGTGDGPESETFRNKDTNGDGILEGFGDGILDIYDYGTGLNQYGNIGQGIANANPNTTYLLDTDGDGIPDYLDVKSNGTTFDIANNKLLYDYKILDANNDGIIDGTADIDKDGILDTFDSNTSLFGSPRDIRTKLFLDFDGRNDYAQSTSILGTLDNASLMAWINLNSGFTTEGVVIGQNNFQIGIDASKKLFTSINGTKVTYNTALSSQRWYHIAAVYGGGSLKLYLNGTLVRTQARTGSINNDTSLLTIGRDPATIGPIGSKYFKGKMDEVRVFNVALTDSQLQRMVYQEIQDSSSEIRGAIIPKNIATAPSSLPFANLLRYYRMDNYKDDIIDDLTTPMIDIIGTKIYNHKNIFVQQAPMPFLTERTGTFSEAVNSPTKEIRGMDVIDKDWSIIKVQHDITDTVDNIDLGMIVDSGKNIVMNNNTKIQNDWYLKLDGTIDLTGMSQLLQTNESDLDVSSSGSIERDQLGQSNKYNYNYWSSPVGPKNTSQNNSDYTIGAVMKDGGTSTPKNINWITGYDGSPSTSTIPVSIAKYWLYKFDNLSNNYSNWTQISETAPLKVGLGYTMKGSGSPLGNQNYTFVGKPNNGTISSNTVGGDQLLLVGNPYPSALDADAFINENINSIQSFTSPSIDGTLYFWEHYATNNTHILRAYQGGYAVRNLTGGIAPSSSAVDFISKSGTPSRGIPNRFIPVGQGFFVIGKKDSGGTIMFKNNQRAFFKEDNTTMSNPTFKTTATLKQKTENNSADEKIVIKYKKVRLGFNSHDDFHRQVLLGFMDEKATSAIDLGYDALSIDDFPNDMYFLNGENQLVIQGEGFFDNNISYPVGVKTDADGKVTFNIDGTENFDSQQHFFIYDKLNDTYNDITNAPYEVFLNKVKTSDRFYLRFNDGKKAITEAIEAAKTGLFITYSSKTNSITINNNTNFSIEEFSLYNTIGQNLMNSKISTLQELKIPLQKLATGMYIAKVKTATATFTQKIIVP